MGKVFVKRKKVNEIIGDILGIRSNAPKVSIESIYMDFESPDEALGVLKFLKKFCKVEAVSTLGHPLGRGTIVFSCPKIEVYVHGDWDPSPERNFIRISKGLS